MNIETEKQDMEKYYLKEINDKNCVKSMYNLGNYYQYIGKYDEMEKYYKMAIEQNDVKSMNKLGIYYLFQQVKHCLNIILQWL